MKARRTAVRRGREISVTIDERPVTAYQGETLASVLLVAGVDAFRRAPGGAPRSVFCGMGSCLDCAVTVDGKALVRSCMTPATDGMTVRTGESW